MKSVGRIFRIIWLTIRTFSLLIGFGVIGLLVWLLIAQPWQKTEVAVADGTVIDLTFQGQLAEKPVSGNFLNIARGQGMSVYRLSQIIRTAATDARVKGLIIDLSAAQVPLAQAEELAEAMADYRMSGKRAYAFSSSWDLGRYRLAAAFSDIWMPASGDFSVTGLTMISPYAREFADDQGISAELEKRKSYKSAADFLTERGMNRDLREANQALLDDLRRTALDGIAAARKDHLTVQHIEAALTNAFWRPDLARSLGLIDKLAHRADLNTAMSGPRMVAGSYLPAALKTPTAAESTIALISASGAIRGGRNNPLDADSIADLSLINELRMAEEDDRIDAIILRVDSPGGGYTPSDAIVQTMVQMQKPIIVSMGPVAGSGGYMIAMAGDRIVAHPSTITGSIGVIGGKIVIEDLLDDWGVAVETVESGPFGAVNSPMVPYTPAERVLLAKRIDTIYREFTEAVAFHRELTPEATEAAAQGRIWTGKQALDLGLVDQLGGFRVAVAEAVTALKLDSNVAVAVIEYPDLSPFDRIAHTADLGMLTARDAYSWIGSPERVLDRLEDEGGIRVEMPTFYLK